MDQPQLSPNPSVFSVVLSTRRVLGTRQRQAQHIPPAPQTHRLNGTNTENMLDLEFPPSSSVLLKILARFFTENVHLQATICHFITYFEMNISGFLPLSPPSLLIFLLFSAANTGRRRKRGEVVTKPNIQNIFPLKSLKINAISPFSKNNRRKTNWKYSRIVTIASFLTIPRKRTGATQPQAHFTEVTLNNPKIWHLVLHFSEQ